MKNLKVFKKNNDMKQKKKRSNEMEIGKKLK